MQGSGGDLESASHAKPSPETGSQESDHVTPGNEGEEGMEIVEEDAIEAESEDQVEASLSGMMKGVVNKITEGFQSHTDESVEVTEPYGEITKSYLCSCSSH